MSILPKGRSFIANSGTKAAVLLKGRSSTVNQEPRLQFYQGLNRCGSFPLLSAPHSLFSIWTDIKRSEKIPGAPTWRWGEWIWLTRPSGLHRNSPQGLNIGSIRVFDQIRDPEIAINLRTHFHINCYNFMIFLLCFLHHKNRENTEIEFNYSVSFRDTNFKGGNGWDFGHFGQKSLFHFIEQI